jgi:hypothetical protein
MHNTHKTISPLQTHLPSTVLKARGVGEYYGMVRHITVTCEYVILSIFSHPWTEYQQQKFCVQLLLDGMCKWAKFWLKFWPHHLDHSLISYELLIKSKFVPSLINPQPAHSEDP